MFYVLYPFVTYLQSLPSTSMLYGKSYHRNYAYGSQPQHRANSSSLPALQPPRFRNSKLFERGLIPPRSTPDLDDQGQHST
jgi:hypothetical protein